MSSFPSSNGQFGKGEWDDKPSGDVIAVLVLEDDGGMPLDLYKFLKEERELIERDIRNHLKQGN